MPGRSQSFQSVGAASHAASNPNRALHWRGRERDRRATDDRAAEHEDQRIARAFREPAEGEHPERVAELEAAVEVGEHLAAPCTRALLDRERVQRWIEEAVREPEAR